MLKFRLAPLAAIGLSATIAFAQDPTPSEPTAAAEPETTALAKKEAVSETAAEDAPVKRTRVIRHRAIAKATPVPVATPIPKKPGFWERVFGKPQPKATPVPATPTPKPVVKKVVPKVRTTKPKVAVGDSTEPPKTDKEPKTVPVKPDVEKKPPTTTEDKVPTSTKPPKVKTTAQRGQDFPPSTDNADAEIIEKQKYDAAKAKAVADPKVQELRGKADLANSEDESRKALRSYNKAMFKRMKEIDPSIKDHVDRMEAAVMSRLGE